MKKRILSFMLATTLIVMTSVPVFATPNSELKSRQQKYNELQAKVDKIDDEIKKLNLEIDPLVEKIDANKQEMKSIEQQIENTNIEIENTKEDIEQQEEVLDERVRELYKAGGSSSYLMILFSADSLSDLFSKMNAANKIVEMDKKVVTELEVKEEKLEENIKSLEVKSNQIAKINEETEKTLEEFQEKAEEQEALAEQAKEEREVFEREFLVDIEREVVQGDINIIKSRPRDIDTLTSAINRLTDIRDKQLKSPIVKSEVSNAIENARAQIQTLRQEQLAQENNQNNQNQPNRGESSATGNAIVDYAYRFLGTPYLWGGTTPAGFDCSGFTSYVYRHAAGIEISRTTHTQRYKGRSVPYSSMQLGDLVFTSGYGHVGIYVGNGKFIHAPQTGDVVKVSNIYNFVEARRIIN